MDPLESLSDSPPLSPVTRRRLIAGGVSALALGGIAAHQLASAQDSATPATGGAGVASPVVAKSGVGAATPGATPAAMGPTMPPEFGADVTNWPVEGGNFSHTRHAQGSSISSGSVAQLAPVWSFAVSTNAPFGSLVANPIVFGETVYLQDAKSNIYALDKATGTQKWMKKYDQDVPSGGPNGIALGYGLVVFPVGQGDVAALDAATGAEAWHVSIKGPLGEGITMAPLVYDNTVYISTIPGTPKAFYQGGMRGVIHALDVRDGSVIWYFDTTTDNLWGNARVNSGGGLWHPPSIDANGNLYVGVGNAAPWPGTKEYPAGASRPGPNDYANCLIRINPTKASVDWYINVAPHDLFDHDNQLSPILATVKIGGIDRPAVFSSGKHGYVVAADAETGAQIWRTAVGKHDSTDLAGTLPADGATPEAVLPGAIGGVETPMAYADGAIYAAVLDLPFSYTASKYNIPAAGLGSGTGELVALDAATGKIRWSVALPTMVLGGATVVNDVVFTGGLDGVVRGHRVDDGSPVFSHQAAAGINASFAVSGDYLFVPAGAFVVPSSDSAKPTPAVKTELIAFKIGAAKATPAAG